MARVRPRVPVEPRAAPGAGSEAGRVNSNVNVNSGSERRERRESLYRDIINDINNDINIFFNLEKDSAGRRERTVAFKVDLETYLEYRRLDYGQRHFIQEALRAFLSRLLQSGVPSIDPRKVELRLDIPINLSIDQKILLTETCRDVARKLEEYRNAIKCVRISLSTNIKSIEKCIQNLAI